MKNGNKVERGLIIRTPWSDLILDGHKTWELRGSKTNIRGIIAIIQSETKHIYGYIDLVDCIGPLTYKTLYENNDKHKFLGNDKPLVNFIELPYENTYAWVLTNPYKLKKPIPYKHPIGAVIWVKL